MPEPRTLTAAMSAVANVADRALISPAGVSIYWRSPPLSFAECKLRARSFQQSFSSLRSRARRKVERSSSARDLDTKGPYDGLACTRGELPSNGGAYVTLQPATSIADSWEIVDNASGEALNDMGAGRSEAQALLDRATRHHLNPSMEGLTAEEWDKLTELWPALNPSAGEPWHWMDGEEWYPRPSEKVGSKGGSKAPSKPRKPSTPTLAYSTEREIDPMALALSGNVFGEGEGEDPGSPEDSPNPPQDPPT